jgi:hypothetical protein
LPGFEEQFGIPLTGVPTGSPATVAAMLGAPVRPDPRRPPANHAMANRMASPRKPRSLMTFHDAWPLHAGRVEGVAGRPAYVADVAQHPGDPTMATGLYSGGTPRKMSTAEGVAMAGKSPRKTNAKKQGKTLKEKQAAKRR